MKKAVVYFIISMSLLFSVSGLSVTLNYPENNQVNTTSTSMRFTCTATLSEGEELASLSLYNNISNWQAVETNASAVTSGTEFTFTEITSIPYGIYLWNCLATDVNAASVFADGNFTFAIMAPPNNAPVFQTIPDTSFTEEGNTSINLSAYSSDADNDSLTYTSTVSNSKLIIAIADNIATLTADTNFFGEVTASFSASDGNGGLATSNNILVNISGVNDIPVLVSNITNKTWAEGSSLKMDLKDYFSDPDNDKLSFTYTPQTNINVTVDNFTSEAIITASGNWTGSSSMAFTAIDGKGGTITSNTFFLIITKIETPNKAPVIDSFQPTLVNPLLEIGETQEFSIVSTDPDNDPMNVSWFLNDEALNITGNSYKFTPGAGGSYKIKASVTDRELTDSQEWTITVNLKQDTNISNPETEEAKENLCGNRNIDAGENCLTCPLDVICNSGETCVEGLCRIEKKESNLWKIGIALLIISAVVGVGIFIYRRNEEKRIFGVRDVEPKPIKQINEFKKPIENMKSQAAEVDYVEKPKDLKVNKTVKEVLLKNFIKTNIDNGKSFEAVKKILLKVGWKEDEIIEAYKEMKIEEAFKKDDAEKKV